jgi:hypothetical protein
MSSEKAAQGEGSPSEEKVHTLLIEARERLEARKLME